MLHKIVLNKKHTKLLVLLAAFAVITSIVGTKAFFTSSDTSTNTYVVGNVHAELLEPSWEGVNSFNLAPGQVLDKDPQVENTGTNQLFAFIMVSVPKREIYTYTPSTDGSSNNPRNDLAVTQLFILSEPNTGWTLIKTDTSDGSVNKYLYAYGSSTALTKVDAGAITNSVFDSIRYCYAVEGQGLDSEEEINVKVNAYAIQTENIGSSDTKEPLVIWNIISDHLS